MSSQPLNRWLFGKLPALGDFVSRGLDMSARDRLDGWLSAEMQDGRTRWGDDFDLRYDAARSFARQTRRGAKTTIVVELVGGETKTVTTSARLGVRYLPRLPVPRKGIVDDASVSWIKLDDRTGYVYVRRIRGDLERLLDQALRAMPGVTGSTGSMPVGGATNPPPPPP